jgi:sugar phosphate isomerase/epimerase
MFLARVDQAVAQGLSPEIVFDASALDGFDRNHAERVAKILRDHGIENTMHGPFMDLSPGGPDPKIRAVTRQRIDQTMEAAEIFKPQCVVFHPGYDPWRYHGYEDLWLKNSIDMWGPVVGRAEKIEVTLALENVYERTPETLLSLLEHIASPRFRSCLDVGHLHAFAKTPIEQWLRTMGPHIAEMHLHDNAGAWDEHLPMGQGEIDFPRLFGLIRQYVKEKPIYTLEPEREEDLEPSIHGFLKLAGRSRA